MYELHHVCVGVGKETVSLRVFELYYAGNRATSSRGAVSSFPNGWRDRYDSYPA